MRSRARSRLRWMLVLAAIGALSCRRVGSGGLVSAARSPAERPLATGLDLTDSAVGPGRFVPDLFTPSSGLVDVLADGSRRFVVAGMRLIDHPDGSIERAREILPVGPTRILALPGRVGGGVLVYVYDATSGMTELWRAKGFTDKLEPVAQIWGVVSDVVAGFDNLRLYARMTSGEIKAFDPVSGQQLPLGTLPPATRISLLAFADAWRAVAVVDMRGPLATFDAGNTWRSVMLDEPNVTHLAVRDGDFVLETPRGRFLLSSAGDLTRDETRAQAPPPPSRTGAEWGQGRRPLRAAIEDGWPVRGAGGERAAIVAEAGRLYLVSLKTGAVLASREGAFREDDATCHAVPLGRGIGFVCDGGDAGSSLYAFELPFEMREIARFVHQRMIIASGNGGLVVRGSCGRGASVDYGASDSFCFIDPSGHEAEVVSPSSDTQEAARLRPVVLRDGRPAFVLPPDERTPGKLFVARSGGFAIVPFQFDEPHAHFAKASMLDGVEEPEPGVLAAWMLEAEDLHGIRIALDGKVSVGHGSADVERTAVSGRWALDWGTAGRGSETLDGGMSWQPVDLPSSFDLPRAPRTVAACGPVGCVHESWLRVGWGRVQDAPDLLAATVPKPSRVALAPPRGISMRCEPTGEVSGPAPKPPTRAPPARREKVIAPPAPTRKGAPPKAPLPPAVAQIAPLAAPSPAAHPVWSAFRGLAPPSISGSELGLQAGTDPLVTMQARIYTWGARGAEWARGGHVQARFDDRFDLLGVRVTAATPPPWVDEERAADALGLAAGQTMNWSALLDPSGQAAVLIGQRGAGRADLYGAAPGEPLSIWREVDNLPLPIPTSVVRVGPTWFFLASTAAQGMWIATIYRVDGGVARRLARLPRVPAPPGERAPRLMRRAQRPSMGLLMLGSTGFNQMIRDWYVLPFDGDTGDLDEPVRLFGSDLEGQIPPRCPPDQDGWMVNTDLSLAPAIRIVDPPSANVSAIELRLRIDPGAVCVDSMAARVEGLREPGAAPSHSATASSLGGTALPLVATDPASGRRWLLKCGR